MKAPPSPQPTPEEREDMIRSAMGAQGLAGVHLPYEEAARIFDEVMARPRVKLQLDDDPAVVAKYLPGGKYGPPLE